MSLLHMKDAPDVVATTISPRHFDDAELVPEEVFTRMIALERKRAERSKKMLVLMLLETGHSLTANESRGLLTQLEEVMTSATRETDIAGWYERDFVLGVLFTEIAGDRNTILNAIRTRVNDALCSSLNARQFSKVKLSFQLFPEEWNDDGYTYPTNSGLHRDLFQREERRKGPRMVKRAMDIAGSMLALVLGAPVFLVIALLVKLTSKGPVFFRQQRVGQYGVPFTFLKFRSMFQNNDASIHREYVRKLISGQAERMSGNGSKEGVFKLTHDPRITSIGRFLRRTSLDELPQFLNVLMGEMSLVGPRPALPYEVEAYDVWHRRRMLEAKPGITGLWQVHGRSRVKFDEMVRLDLRYAKNWSPWLDLKILLRTPRVILFDDGAC